MANTIFQKALLQVRSLCENACSSGSGLAVEGEAIYLVDTDWYSTMTLDDFCERQRLQVTDACQKLLLLQKRVVEILCAACEVRVTQKCFVILSFTLLLAASFSNTIFYGQF